MMWKAAGLVLASAVSACASAPPVQTAAGETTIPFIRSAGIIDWRAAGDDLLYIHGSGGQWYRVQTMGSCPRLKTAISLGFETNGPDQLDRFGAILAEGQRCQVESITRSDAPPKKPKA